MADERDIELLCDIKNYLDITWDDALADKKLMGIMRRGMTAISNKIGECDFYGDWLWDELDFETGLIGEEASETLERTLLFDYMLYARAGDVQAFWQNYREEIIALQISRKVETYASEKQQWI